MSLERLLSPLARRVRNLVTRATVALVDDAKKMQELQLEALEGETLDQVEHWQGYGLSVHPKPDAEALVLSAGGIRAQAIVIAVADRRYRLKALAEGEVALHDDQEQTIHLKRAGIEINAPKGLKIIGNVEITGNTQITGNTTIQGTGTVQKMLSAQNGLAITGGTGGTAATMTGDIALTGSLTATGGLSAASMAASGGVSAGSVTSTGAVAGKTLAMDGKTLTAGIPGEGNVSVPYE